MKQKYAINTVYTFRFPHKPSNILLAPFICIKMIYFLTGAFLEELSTFFKCVSYKQSFHKNVLQRNCIRPY